MQIHRFYVTEKKRIRMFSRDLRFIMIGKLIFATLSQSIDETKPFRCRVHAIQIF